MNNRSEVEQKAALVKKLHAPAESGQAIVIIAMLMVVLLGMLGLAIDGGGLFFLQRDAQNATDAAVLSATYAICTQGDPVAAGLATMAKNGFNNNGITNAVNISYPPVTGEAKGRPGYVEVSLEAHKPAYFIQLVYRQPLMVETNAIGNCLPPFDPSKVGGLWAGNRTCQNTIMLRASTTIVEGSLFSNNQMAFSGSSATLSDGTVHAVNLIDTPSSGNVVFDPNPEYQPKTGVPYQNDPLNLDINMYAPGGEIASTILDSNYYHAILPGHKDYKNGTWEPDKNSEIKGLYYVEGDVNVAGQVDVGSEGVSIVATGSINFDATTPDGSPVKFYDGVMNFTKNDVQYPGILFFSNEPYEDPEKCRGWAIKLNGQGVDFYGILYAPQASVDTSGPTVRMVGSVIAQSFSSSGSLLQLIYEESLLPGRPPKLQMVE